MNFKLLPPFEKKIKWFKKKKALLQQYLKIIIYIIIIEKTRGATQ